MAYSLNMKTGQRAERKLLITVATWKVDTETKACILGTRTEDSSVEFNADTATTTDILGINYTDVNKTQPQQTFDPANIIGGDELMAYMNQAALRNDINAYNGVFDVYLVAGYLSDSDKYYAVKHSGCSIIPSSLGGDSYVSMPFDVYFSNEITEGSVPSIAKADLLEIDTKFTATSATA